MSKSFVYEKRIEIPSDCQVTLEGKTFTVSGPKGTLARSFPEPYTTVAMEGNEIVASTNISRKKTKALVGTVIAHLRNMFIGVQHGYTYEMKIVFSHFPMTVEVQGQEVLIKNFIGERGVRRARLIGDVQVKVTDTAPDDDRVNEEINACRERMSFEDIGLVANHEQKLHGLRYATTAWRSGEEGPFHEEAGYWLWYAGDKQVLRCFMVPRAVTVIAGGTAEPDATSFHLEAAVGSRARRRVSVSSCTAWRATAWRWGTRD